jgi:hypothetical protein
MFHLKSYLGGGATSCLLRSGRLFAHERSTASIPIRKKPRNHKLLVVSEIRVLLEAQWWDIAGLVEVQQA